MKRHGNSKYKPKYARELLNGLRQDGKSIEEVCSVWGVSRGTYDAWVKTHEKFKTAHEVGELDKIAWWRKVQRDVASGVMNGNAGVINLALKNEAGYVDKQETVVRAEERLTVIKIEMLPRREDDVKVIEGEYKLLGEDDA